MVEILSYAYNLEYEERPDYNRLKFMFKKILLDQEYIPNNKFDWSVHLKPYIKNNRNLRHSSISSCDLQTDEIPLLELNNWKNLQSNILQFKSIYMFD